MATKKKRTSSRATKKPGRVAKKSGKAGSKKSTAKKKTAKKKAGKKKTVKKASRRATGKKKAAAKKKAARKSTTKKSTTKKKAARKTSAKKAKKKATAGKRTTKKRAAKKTTSSRSNRTSVKKSTSKRATGTKKAVAASKKRVKKTAASRKASAKGSKPSGRMGKIKLDAIIERLARQREEMLSMYKNDLRVGSASNEDGTEDIVDRANNAYSRELTFSLSDSERELLLMIEEAQERLEKGDFGSCTHCGITIGEARLEAVPWARFCIDCQELEEKGLLREY